MTLRHYYSTTDVAYTEKERDTKSNNSVALALHVLLVTVILVFGIALRISQLDRSSLWFDDAWVALVARMSASQLTHIGMTAFGFNAILWGWLHLVGFSEVSAKFIPFLAGCLAPVAVYLLLIRRGLGWISATIAALILVVAPMNVQYSATVKQYTSEALLTISLIWLAWKVLEEPRRKNIAWLGIAACFSIIVSSLTVFVVIPAVCLSLAWTALKHRGCRVDCIIMVAAVLAFTGVWIPLMAGDGFNPALRLYWSKYYVSHADGLHGMVVSTFDLARHFVAGLTHRSFGYVAISATVATCAAARRRTLLTLILWSPVVLVYLASLTKRAPFGGGRTDIFLYPLIAVVAALAADEMFRAIKEFWPEKSWLWYAGPIVAAVATLFIIRGARPAFPNHPEEDFRHLVRRVMAQKRAGDVIVIYPPARYAWFLYSKEPFTIAPRKQHPGSFLYTMEAKDTIVPRPASRQ